MGRESPVLILFFLMTILIVLMMVFRYKSAELRHKERLTALDKGSPLPAEPAAAPWTPRIYLLRGLVWLFTGIGLAVFLLGISLTTHYPNNFEYSIVRAQQLRSMGASPEEVKQFMDQSRNSQPQTRVPEGWALLGLVPIGVGLAYIIFYRAEAGR